MNYYFYKHVASVTLNSPDVWSWKLKNDHNLAYHRK